TLQTQTQRTWNDTTYPVGDPRRNNFVPDCDLLVSAANGECGPWQTPSFGSSVPGTVYDRAILNGWGVRPSNWEFSVGAQHELLPRVSASVGYFRRIGGNFSVVDNEALGAGTLPSTASSIRQRILACQTPGRRSEGSSIPTPSLRRET
ncbi:MAG: hypothetical protein DMG01_26750, partial [Acidobacteria bacterium]